MPEASTTEATTTETTTETATTEAATTAELGDAGKKALDEERRTRREAERRAAAAEAELAKLKTSTMSEQEKAVEKARLEGKVEGTTVANARLLRAEVRALAAGKLADPADAISLLDLDSFKVGDDGEVDTKAITAAIDTLVKSKPYLAAAPPRGNGSGDPGPRGEPAASGGMNALIRQAAGRQG